MKKCGQISHSNRRDAMLGTGGNSSFRARWKADKCSSHWQHCLKQCQGPNWLCIQARVEGKTFTNHHGVGVYLFPSSLIEAPMSSRKAITSGAYSDQPRGSAILRTAKVVRTVAHAYICVHIHDWMVFLKG